MTSPLSLDSETNQAFENALQSHRSRWGSDWSFPESATPEELYNEVKEHKDGHHGTRLIKYTSRISGVIQRFEGFFSLVDALVSLNQVAGLVWGGIRFIMRTVSEHLKHFERIIDVLDNISQRLHFYDRYATAIYKRNDRVMTELANAYGDILTVFMTIKKTFVSDSKKLIRSSFTLAIASFWLKNPFDDVVAGLEQRQLKLDREVEHADREANHADREERAIAKWRTEIDRLQNLLRFHGSDCGEKHEQSRNKTSDGSGTWLLEDSSYREWRDSPCVESGRLFWLHGQPGSGKTVLTSLVIEDLQKNKPDTTLLFFYCDYKFEEKKQTNNILRSLLGQLLHSFRNQSPSSVVHDILIDYSNSNSVTEIPLAKVISKLATGCGHVTIVIDALDECQDRGNILTLLRHFPSSICLFISSRNEEDIRDSFQPENHSRLWKQEIRPCDIENDIRKYLLETFEKHLRNHPNFVRDPSLIDHIINTLLQKANGMFLWVFFQVKTILKCRTDYDIRKTLRSLPKGLEETFVRSLKQINEDESSIRLRRLLHLVVCFGHVGIDQLIELLNIDEMDGDWDPDKTINDVSTLASCCGHLIVEMEYFGKQSFALRHLAVYQFLTSNPHSFDPVIETLPEYHCHPLFDVFMGIAETFRQSHRIRGNPNPRTWIAEGNFINQWCRYPELSTRSSDLLTTMFDAPLFKSGTQPGLPPQVVFPNAIHVTAINCCFFEVVDEYYILTSQPSNFSRGPYTWNKVFPHPSVQLTTQNCLTMNGTGKILFQPDSRATSKPVGHPFPPNATHVTVKDVDFVTAFNSNWIVRPSIGVISGEVQGWQGGHTSGSCVLVLDKPFSHVKIGQLLYEPPFLDSSRMFDC